ncbi:unnamed protein product [Prunus armeniaca]
MEQEIYYDPLIENNVDHATIDTIAASDQWSTWRDNLATEMFNEWMSNAVQSILVPNNGLDFSPVQSSPT